MPVVRYVCAGNFGGRGISAFTPAPPRTTSNFSIKFAQHSIPVAQPGTQGVPAPRDWPGPNIDTFTTGAGVGTRNMPAVWYPQLGYVVSKIWDGNFGGVRVFSDNLMPVPAVDPRRLPSGVQGPVANPGRNTAPARPSRRLRSRQVIWPARSTRWQGINGG